MLSVCVNFIPSLPASQRLLYPSISRHSVALFSKADQISRQTKDTFSLFSIYDLPIS